MNDAQASGAGNALDGEGPDGSSTAESTPLETLQATSEAGGFETVLADLIGQSLASDEDHFGAGRSEAPADVAADASRTQDADHGPTVVVRLPRARYNSDPIQGQNGGSVI